MQSIVIAQRVIIIIQNLYRMQSIIIAQRIQNLY